jgi:hypothetical protein
VSKANLALERAGWSLRDWCASSSVSRSYVYALPVDLQPKSITFGRRRIIVESPSAWLTRVGKAA